VRRCELLLARQSIKCCLQINNVNESSRDSFDQRHQPQIIKITSDAPTFTPTSFFLFFSLHFPLPSRFHFFLPSPPHSSTSTTFPKYSYRYLGSTAESVSLYLNSDICHTATQHWASEMK